MIEESKSQSLEKSEESGSSDAPKPKTVKTEKVEFTRPEEGAKSSKLVTKN